jgi:hypothetical protein
MKTIPARRRFLARAAVSIAAIGSSLLGWRAAAQQSDVKVSQAEAKYQDHPKGPQRCEICLQFEPPGTCKIVAGHIEPKGWCQFFAARENAH